jgi:peptide/nickel transport system permease protein
MLRKKIMMLLFLALLLSLGLFFFEKEASFYPLQMNLSPRFQFPFGTDWLGRDILERTFWALLRSFSIGIFASFISLSLALFFGIGAGLYPKSFGKILSLLMDLFMSLPHLVLLILISFILKGGELGVIFGIGLTHWMTLSRLIRSEVLQIRKAPFLIVSSRLGKGQVWQIQQHIMPLLLPQIFVGFTLLIPKSILHESYLTFLGLGLPPNKASIGTMLSESLTYLNSGMWWTVFFPGLALLLMVRGIKHE